MTPTPITLGGTRRVCSFGDAGMFGVLWLLAACNGAPQLTPEDRSTAVGSAGLRDVTMTVEQIQHADIRWEAVRATTMTDGIELPGQLAPNDDRTALVSAPARARVVTVHVRMGDRVSRGQPLVTLQSERGAAARAAYAKAVAELDSRQAAATYARTALDRAGRLLELKAVSRQDVERTRVEKEQADSTAAQAQAEVDRARATLAQLGVDADTGDLILRAPLAGMVLSRDAVPGSVVEAGAPLVMVTDPSTLWLEIAATERIAVALRPGIRVRFTVAELPQAFEATIQNVGGGLDPVTRTLPVHGLVRNGAEALRPAMFATVTVPLGESRAGVAVPESAMQWLDERPVVFVAQPDHQGGARFERRDVELGAQTSTLILIVRGLTAGDLVVTDGAFAVKSEFARSKMPG
jgi:membrane fusion protein, heavy metal efflux system